MAEVGDLKFTPLPKTAMLEIGRLVRAFAEVEDCLDHFIGLVAGLNGSYRTVVLGRSPYSAKLNIARTLSELRDPAARAAFDAVFTQELADIKKRRDLVAHGAYLGRNKRGEFAFLSKDIDGVSDETPGALTVRVFALSTSRIRDNAIAVERSLPAIERALRIEPLREKLHAPSIQPDQPGRRKRRSKKARQRPPSPSRP